MDIEDHLQNYGLFPKGGNSFSGAHLVKGVQICANLTIRGIYTSDNVYDWESLPKEMSFKMVKGGKWSDVYNFSYLPAAINPYNSKPKKENEEQSLNLESSIVEREVATQRKNRDEQSRAQLGTRSLARLQSDPLVELSTVFSYSSLHNPDLIFRDNNVYYSGGSILIRRDIETGEQVFMQGHTDYIVAMDSH